MTSKRVRELVVFGLSFSIGGTLRILIKEAEIQEVASSSPLRLQPHQLRQPQQSSQPPGKNTVLRLLQQHSANPRAVVDALQIFSLGREGPEGYHQECLGFALDLWARDSPIEVLVWLEKEGSRPGNKFTWTKNLVENLFRTDSSRMLKYVGQQSNGSGIADRLLIKSISAIVVGSNTATASEVASDINQLRLGSGVYGADEMKITLEELMKKPNGKDVLSELIQSNLDPGLLLTTSFDNLDPETEQSAILYSLGGENSVKVQEAISDILTKKNYPRITLEALRLNDLKAKMKRWIQVDPENAKNYLQNLGNPELRDFLLPEDIGK